jgi:hypothetical protein
MYRQPLFVSIEAALRECGSRLVATPDQGFSGLQRVRRPAYSMDRHPECATIN